MPGPDTLTSSVLPFETLVSLIFIAPVTETTAEPSRIVVDVAHSSSTRTLTWTVYAQSPTKTHGLMPAQNRRGSSFAEAEAAVISSRAKVARSTVARRTMRRPSWDASAFACSIPRSATTPASC